MDIMSELESIKKIENLLIINGEGLKAKSKLKLYFDNSIFLSFY